MTLKSVTDHLVCLLTMIELVARKGPLELDLHIDKCMENTVDGSIDVGTVFTSYYCMSGCLKGSCDILLVLAPILDTELCHSVMGR